MTNNPSMPCRDINELCPTLKRGVEEFLKRCKAIGLNVLITQTYRSIAYQNQLYAQIPKVTGLKGGESPHNYRIAFDICKNVKGHEYNDYAFFKSCGKIWTDMGGVWGGNWKSPDNPHFEFTNNQGYTPFKNGYVFPDNFKMPWENVTAPIKEEDKEMVTKTVIAIDGKSTEVNRILKDGFNYVKLQDLQSPHIDIGYIASKNLPTVDTK